MARDGGLNLVYRLGIGIGARALGRIERLDMSLDFNVHADFISNRGF